MAEKEIWEFPSYRKLFTWATNDDERNIAACVREAHINVHRGLRAFHKMAEQDKKLFREDTRKDVMELIAHYINSLFTQELTSQETFDEWHTKVCDKICEVSNKYVDYSESGYSYELAEKVLNMTVKNMFDMGNWNIQLEPLKKYLHS
jgi:hypothetical protein